MILAGRHEDTLEGIAGTLPMSSVAALHTGDLTDPSCRAALADLAASLDAGS
jgi:hypothetical protein